uniref:Proteasome-associated protein ECM29 homolog n=1 Tax=Phallusia mammillata TaxID=59560 RepID=A0A6F9DCD1_9ASCI|nr:proteasome-associated protein ECM29 homolog [Phallusia mammillata]
MLNYLHNRSGHVTQDALDWVRAEAVKSSALMETASRCLRQYDEEVLKNLAPLLADLTKRGVGLSTKAGCAHLITSLVTSCGNDLTPFAGKFINALTNGLADRSLAVRKVNSTAIGHLSRVAKDATLEKLLMKMKQWYLEKEEETYKHASASVFYAVARHCPDALNRHSALVLPLAFFGMHEKQQLKGSKAQTAQQSNSMTEGDDVNFALSSRDMWEAIWNEFTPGSETAVRLHLKEIVEISSGALQSSSWEAKAQAAASMSTVAKKQRPGTVVRPQLENLLRALFEGLQGRTWEGKTQLLEALSNVCEHCGDEMTPGELEKAVAVLVKESKREKLTYSVEAITCLANVLQSRKIDGFDQFWSLTRPHLSKEGKESDSDDDEDRTSRKERKTAVLKRQELILKSLCKAWPSSPETQVKFYGEVFGVLSEFAELSTFGVQLAAVKCLSKILESLATLQRVASEAEPQFSDVAVLAKPLASCLTNMKFSAIREEAVKASQHFVKIIAV